MDVWLVLIDFEDTEEEEDTGRTTWGYKKTQEVVQVGSLE